MASLESNSLTLFEKLQLTFQFYLFHTHAHTHTRTHAHTRTCTHSLTISLSPFFLLPQHPSRLHNSFRLPFSLSLSISLSLSLSVSLPPLSLSLTPSTFFSLYHHPLFLEKTVKGLESQRGS